MSGLSFRRRVGLVAVGALLLALVLPVTTSSAAAPGGNNPICDSSGANCWWRVKANLTTFAAPPVGVQGWFTIERPTIHDLQNQHSLAAMFIGEYAGNDITNGIEMGWAVAPSVYGGDTRPHLFAFSVRQAHQDPTCWTKPTNCGWHENPGARYKIGDVGTALQNQHGVERSFFILRNTDGRWLVEYEGDTLGWYDSAYWDGSGGFHPNEVSWYGEVQHTAAGLLDLTGARGGPGCTEMGNGNFGHSQDAATVGGLGYWTQDASGFHNNWAHPVRSENGGSNLDWYDMGDQLNQSWFTYGGSGGREGQAAC